MPSASALIPTNSDSATTSRRTLWPRVAPSPPSDQAGPRPQTPRSSVLRRFTFVHFARKSSSRAVRASAGRRLASSSTDGSAATAPASDGSSPDAEVAGDGADSTGVSTGAGAAGDGLADGRTGAGRRVCGSRGGVLSHGGRTSESGKASRPALTASRSRRPSSAISPFFFPRASLPPGPAPPTRPAP